LLLLAQHEEYTTTPPQGNHIPSSAQWSSGEASGSSAYTPGVVEATRGGGGAQGKVEGPIKVNAIVCFKLMVPHAGPADEVFIVGNNAIIGSWLPDKGVRLEASLANDPGLYTLDLILPLDVSALEYKYVLRKAGGTAYRWEEKLSNRRLVVGESASGMYLEVLEGEFDVSTGKKNRMVLPVRELTEMELRGLDYDDVGGISGIASTTAWECGGVEAGSSFDPASQAALGSGVGYSGGEVGGSPGKEDESYGSTVRGIPQDLKEAQGEIERLREALAVSNSKVEQLVGMTGTLDQARKLLESKSKDVDVLKEELAEYQRNQAAAASQSSQASGGGGKAGGKELEEMRESLAKHQDMVKSLTSQLKEMGAKFQKAKDEYEAEIKKLTEALQSAKKDQASIGDALKAELEARKTALEHVDASMEALKTRMGEFKSAEEALKNDLAAAVKERDALSASISEKDKEVASLKSERDALSQSISGKDKEVTSLVSSLTAERDALSASISEKDKEVASLRAEKEAISASISDKEREVASLKAEKDKEVASLRAEKDKEVASLKAERDALATEKRLAEGVMGSQLEAEATKKTLADNARNLVQMEQLQKETQEQLDYAITLNRELDEELDQLKKEVQRQSGETMELSNALSEQLDKFKAQEGALARASQAQKATEAEADELKAKIVDLEKRIEETMSEKAKVEAAQEEALASLKNAEKGIKAAEADAANSRSEGEVLKGQVQSLELRVAATARDMALLRSQAETGGGASTELISELKGIRELQLKSDHEARIASIQRDAVMREFKSYKEVSLSFEADLRERLFAAERDVASLSSVSSRGPAACKSLVTMKDTLQQRVDKIKPFIDAFCGAATSGGEGVDKSACAQLTERAHAIGEATMQRGIKGLERVGKACEAVKGMCDVLGEAQEGVKSACSVQHSAEER
jgi:predicted  nucleic acid-binding Zn-ribbon protein